MTQIANQKQHVLKMKNANANVKSAVVVLLHFGENIK